MTDETDDKGMEEAKGVSRRNFIKGVISSGVAASSANYLFRATSVFAQATGDPGDRLLTLNVNGQQRRVDVMKQETLAFTLRYKLGLTGTKLGCDRAAKQHQEPVAHLKEFVEIFRNHQHGSDAIAQVAEQCTHG